MTESRIQHRRAVEALRAGVPNRDAVAALGSSQRQIEAGFAQRLEAVAALPQSGTSPRGLLVAGGFGTGKSHLLEHLRHVGLDRGFVVSQIVVSKETPLHDPSKVFRAAIERASVPGRQGPAMSEIAATLRPGPAHEELYRWTRLTESGLNHRFAASVSLFDKLRHGDPEFVDMIVRFWSGDPLRVSDLRRRLREIGEDAMFTLTTAPERELSLQRFRFMPRLVKAAGYAGWVLLVDEVELIGRYSPMQRAKSYAEVERLMAGPDDDRHAPTTAVLAITDDFEAEVLSGKNDWDKVPEKLRAKGTREANALAKAARTGMRTIEREAVRLEPPDAAELDRVYARIKRIHGDAFGWNPPDVRGTERLQTTRMRQYVRAWITEWDLVRMDPSYQPDIETTEIRTDYTEDPDA